MKYWYFRFEGKFTTEPANAGDALFSSCLVPDSNFQRSKALFNKVLREQNIALIRILEYFPVDGEELDPEDDKNYFWIEWYKDTKLTNEPNFDVWHVYELDEQRKLEVDDRKLSS